ncbi:MAG TPA: hypothetical protein VKE42_09095 [Candidatus Cybelea sp.]|nr:hypothetical protein [Candidatus Cybelea sp.]
MTDDVAQAEAVVNELLHKRSRLVAHATELTDERFAISFGSGQGYAPEAFPRLGEINAALALLDSELRSVDVALVEARKRLALEEGRAT